MTDEPREMIGQEMTYVCDRHGTYTGVVAHFRRVPMMDRKTGERFDGWRFTLRLPDGRLRETCGMSRPAPRSGATEGDGDG